MRRTVFVEFTAGMALALLSGPAAAGRSHTNNLEAIPATCTELGDLMMIEVVNLGRSGTGTNHINGWRCLSLIRGCSGEIRRCLEESGHRDANAPPEVTHHGLL